MPESLLAAEWGSSRFSFRNRRTRICAAVAVAVASVLVIVLAVALPVALTDRSGSAPSHAQQDSQVLGGSVMTAPAPAPSADDNDSVIHIVMQGSDAKIFWSEAICELFNNSGYTYEGRRILIHNVPTSSMLQPAYEATIYAPSNIQWVRTSEDLYGKLVSSEADMCVNATLNVPIGVMMWRKKAEALGWPEANITLEQLVQLAREPAGWASVPGADPEWGFFKYGHGNPNASNSGREITMATIYSINRFPMTHLLTYDDIWSDKTMDDMRTIERATYHLDFHDKDLLDSLVARGPRYLDAAVTYEALVVPYNVQYGEQLLQQYNDTWAFIFPADGIYWNHHPLCILDVAHWNQNNSVMLEAAKIFLEFADSEEVRELGPRVGVRPADPCVNITGPGSRLTLEYGGNPLKNIDNVPELPFQTDEIVLQANLMWKQVKKPCMVCLGIENSLGMSTSGGMEEVMKAALSFLRNLTDEDYLRLIVFDKTINPLISGPLQQVRDDAVEALSGLSAVGVGSALYGTLSDCMDFMSVQQTIFGARNYTYEVVVMANGNGDDYLNFKSRIDARVRDLALDSPTPVHVSGIIYNVGLDTGFSRDFFNDIANRTSGHMYMADSANIQSVYDNLALYF